MSLALLAMGLVLQAASAPDTAIDPVSVYVPILEQALATYPARKGLPVALGATTSGVECSPHCTDAAYDRRHSTEVVRRLKARGLIQTVCETRAGHLGCPSRPRHLFVALSPVQQLPGGSKIKPVVMTPGVPIDSAIAAAADSAEVPIDVRVDVMVFAPCRAASGTDCRHPDAVGYRYFLQAQPDNTYRVVARLLTWQT